LGVSNKYTIAKIDSRYAKEWILNKHYARRLPSISFAFGLFDDTEIMVGVCTFGYPPNYNFNNGKCIFDGYEVLTLELNRLITNDGLDNNALSYFVSKCLRALPRPSCIVSYSDPNNGHHGYIYQATNWLYTGESTAKHRYHFADGTTFDIRRGIDKKILEHGDIVKIEKLKPTHRYIYFNGNKRDRKLMHISCKMKILPYPKGDNMTYDTSYKCKDVKLSDII